jgi:hypothetical protein
LNRKPKEIRGLDIKTRTYMKGFHMVGGPACNIRKLRVFFVKRRRTSRVDRYLEF